MKRSQADIWFSKCVRERTDWICEYTQKDYKHNPGGLQCMHVYGRRARNVRWHPDNAMAGNAYAHRYFTENPIAYRNFYIEKNGEGKLEMLTERWNDFKIKYSKNDLKDIAAHYKKEHEEMQEKRNHGIVGYLEFTAYD